MSSVYEQLAGLTPAQRALFEKRLAEKGIQSARSADAISPRENDESLPLSFAQQRLWFVQQLDPNNTAYNAGSALRLGGKLDPEALRQGLQTIVERHESLRTRFIRGDDGKPQQRIVDSDTVALPLIDLTGEESALKPALQAADAAIEQLISQPFDLEQPLLRFSLLRLADDDHLLVIVTHHIISDRWSVMVFMRELAMLYRARLQGEQVSLPALPIQYADWAIWQREHLRDERLQTLIDFWQSRLAGPLPYLELPTDHALPAVASNRGAHHALTIDAALADELKALASRYRVTLFSLMLTAFKVLLHRYSGSSDIIVGSEVANRDRSETSGLIGLLVNTLVLRSNLADDPTFEALLSQVHDNVLAGLEHQELPFEKLVEVLNPDRNLDQLTPLFQAKFDLQQVPLRSMKLEGLSLERYPVAEQQTKYQLRFNLQDGTDGIYGQIEYSTDLFEADTIERMVSHYISMLRGIVANAETPLSQLPLLDKAERHFLLHTCNDNQQARSGGLMHELFEQQVKRNPDAKAVIDSEQNLSYAELNDAADQLAAQLKARGVKSESTVGVCMPRSVRMIVALLGILKAGGSYVPLDPNYPTKRLSYIVDDAEIDIVIDDGGLPAFNSERAFQVLPVTELMQPVNEASQPVAIGENQLAYVIYTSGSTGMPKGVAIEHSSAVAMLHWARAQYDDNELSGVLASTSVCFDLSVFEIFVPLAWGGSLIVADNLLAVNQHPARDQVTLLNTVPSLLRQLLSVHALPPKVTTINLAGEPLPPNLVRDLQALPQIRHIYNLYGPSEDTTYSTCAPLDIKHFGPEAERVPIGVPIENTQALVLDANQQLVPLGVGGELYLGGAGLARGYLNRAEMTEERFVANPLLDIVEPRPERLYRTGDKVVRRAAGHLEFLGRFDHQFKIRGFRIEAGEIESALREHNELAEALVVAHKDDAGESQLLAYIVPDNNANDIPATASLRAWLVERLPSPMVPTLWHVMEALPRLPNGKVDHGALPKPDAKPNEQAYVAPTTSSEKSLATIWGELLPQSKIGIHDDFFALGGHSLLAIELVTRIEQAFNYTLPLKALFQTPTIATLAQFIDEQRTEAPNDSPVIASRPPIVPDSNTAGEPFALTDIQQAYWLGRSGAFELGNVATHGYREINIQGIEPEKIEQALNQLIARHGMLRAVIDDNGQQRVLDKVEHYPIALSDLSTNEENTRETALLAIRERLSHQQFSLDCWPLFHIEATRLGADRLRYFVSFDVVIGDAWSLQILGREMAQLLAGIKLEPLQLGFRDYVLAEQAFMESEAYQRSVDFWENKLDQLPPSPQLPLLKSPSEIDTPRFSRRSARLNKARWQALKQQTAATGLSPSAVVLTAFSEVLAKWSQKRQFTLNLTLFNRHPSHPDVGKLIGDFTSSLLLAVDASNELGFGEQARQVQSDLWEALEHRAVSGVKVQRDLARKQNRGGGALMPVVFTSTLGQSMQSIRPGQWQAEVGYALSQTSQVYLDHQASDIDGELQINWDAIEDLFPEGVLDTMFAAYTRLLEQLADNAALWQSQPDLGDHDYLTELNSSLGIANPDANTLLQTPFFKQVQTQPDAIAVIDAHCSMSYGELAQRVSLLSKQLSEQQCQTNELIAVSLDKGWQQVVATLAVLTAGSAYVPIDPTLPETRRHELIADTQARIVISTGNDWPDAVKTITVPDIVDSSTFDSTTALDLPPLNTQITDLAYVIYTSGSTGKPKGVMIDHRGASNTIADINRRMGLTSSDRVFALSSLSFDLSVYDLFGTLAAGAAIVMPDAEKRRDPAHWLDLVTKHQVSVWNSVPALMQLLLNELENTDSSSQTPLSLREVMLSGDWIPLSLPKQLNRLVPSAKLTSLGGATEASIWSISHPVTTLEDGWNSVPYGRPMDKQSWYILDENLRPCPPWVTGQLYIGGIGLARGYWKRPTLTTQQFIPNPLQQSDADPVLYRTGDLGRYRPEGSIEFLGREDHQVKIRGHRIELGEIEYALQQHPALEGAVVTTHGTPPELVAYVVAQQDASDADKNPLQSLAFKANQQTQQSGKLETASEGIALPTPAATVDFRRQSHRQFLEESVTFESFAGLLANLAALNVEGAPRAKYLYPSAGSLYPVEIYLSVKPKGIDGLDGGWYRYNPVAHTLIPLAVETSPESDVFYSINKPIFEQSAFSLFMVGNLAAIEPVYGERARDFCLLEAGYIGQLLMEQGPDQGMGFCPMNDPDFDKLIDTLALDSSRIVLHGLVGGAIAPEWSTRWMAMDSSNSRSFIERLQDHLREHLPEYMVPSRFMLLEELPLSANGKIDRQRLPAPDIQNATNYRAPVSELDQQVTALWCQTLQLEQVGMDDNFFQLGGNSLSAMQLLSGLRKLTEAELSIADLFSALTPAQQVALINDEQAKETVSDSIQRVARDNDDDGNNSATDQLSDDAVHDLLAQMLSGNQEKSDQGDDQ